MVTPRNDLKRIQSLVSERGVVSLQMVFKDLAGRPKNLLVPANLLESVLKDGVGFDGCSTGMAQPMYVVATNIGKIPISTNYYLVEKNEKEYVFSNYKGEQTTLPNIP